MIYGRPLILKNMPPFFKFKHCTNTVVPVWVNLPSLQLDLWNKHALPKICSKIRNPFVLVCYDEEEG